MSKRKYYAKLWECGHGTVWANSGENCVTIQAYGSAKARDSAVESYAAPNHCPTATLESVKASDGDVRLEARWQEKIWQS